MTRIFSPSERSDLPGTTVTRRWKPISSRVFIAAGNRQYLPPPAQDTDRLSKATDRSSSQGPSFLPTPGVSPLPQPNSPYASESAQTAPGSASPPSAGFQVQVHRVWSHLPSLSRRDGQEAAVQEIAGSGHHTVGSGAVPELDWWGIRSRRGRDRQDHGVAGCTGGGTGPAG